MKKEEIPILITELPNKRPFVGEPVQFMHKAKKKRVTLNSGSFTTRWVRQPSTKVEEGIYIGYRIKKDGFTSYYCQGTSKFSLSRHVNVAMVIVDERKDPIPVPWESLDWPTK